jgi:hypothetical protein
MGKKTLGYDDAVKLLGSESKVVAALSKLAGAGLVALSASGVPAALGLFDLKNEVADLGQEAVKTLRKRLTGLGRFKRSELLEAAHAVLVVSAFFTALDDLDAELETALNSASLELTGAEQAALATDKSQPGACGLADLAHELITPGQIPGLDMGMTDRGNGLRAYYNGLAHKVSRFATGTSTWDERDETTRDRWSQAITEILPSRALVRYEEQVTRLSGEFPEFAFWAHRVGIQTILSELRAVRKNTTELGTALHTATALLATAAYGSSPEKVRSDLISRYREQVAKPVAGAAGTTADEVRLPPLQELYVTPSYRLLKPQSPATDGIERITETRWMQAPCHADLGAMVLEYLISTEAAQVPLVLLGQPGSGKSVFTQMLAAELDPRDYIVIRVELRAVPADTGIQQQIEAGLENLTGNPMPWSTLAQAAGSAQPVILLDGFDELLQASGVSHFDFLERVQEFQEREAELHRPVAVIVTSRTAVANQVRYPAGTPVARLEEFEDDQVSQWLSVWNHSNPARPLEAKTALAQGELARQPLLLFLLALFHSGGGNLTPGISQAHLFERLFNNFVERDIAKLDRNLTELQRQHAIQHDLDNLSMVAFAMFNRGRQSVTDADLIADLTSLQPENNGQARPAARAAALSIADRMAGRFFFRLFMHTDEATRGQHAMRSSYEFLHASFGEFLVGRWIVNELSRLGEQVRRTADDPYPQPPNDSKLHALLSVTVLSTREQRVLGFIEDLLAGKSAVELVDLRKLIDTLFHTCLRPRSHNAYPQYQPSVQTAPTAYAAYSANLILLLLLVTQAEGSSTKELGRSRIPVSELGTLGTTPVLQHRKIDSFRAVTRLWHAQLTPSEWNSLLEVVRVYSTRQKIKESNIQEPGLEIGRWTRTDFRKPISGYEILYGHSPDDVFQKGRVRLDSPAGHAFREAALLGNFGYQGVCETLLPYVSALGPLFDADAFQIGKRPSAILALLIPNTYIPKRRRPRIYIDLFKSRITLPIARLLLSELHNETPFLPPKTLKDIVISATQYAWANINVYLDLTTRVIEVIKANELNRLFDQLFNGIIAVSDGVLGLAGIDDSSDLHGLETRIGPADLLAMLGLRDLLGLPESQDLHELHYLLDSPPLEEQQRRQRRARDYRVLQVALWTAMIQRGLPVRHLPPALNRDDAMRLESKVPNFVTHTRQLAAQYGYPDPFPTDVADAVPGPG